jgi:hypothetical protein
LTPRSGACRILEGSEAPVYVGFGGMPGTDPEHLTETVIDSLRQPLLEDTPLTRIVDLFKEDRKRITNKSDRSGSALRTHDLFQQTPFLTSN